MPPDRRHPDSADTDFRELVNHRLDQGSQKMKGLEDALRANTDATERIAKNTQEIVDFFEAIKGGMKVLTWLGKLAKPLTALVLFFSAVWGLVVVLIKRSA